MARPVENKETQILINNIKRKSELKKLKKRECAKFVRCSLILSNEISHLFIFAASHMKYLPILKHMTQLLLFKKKLLVNKFLYIKNIFLFVIKINALQMVLSHSLSVFLH